MCPTFCRGLCASCPTCRRPHVPRVLRPLAPLAPLVPHAYVFSCLTCLMCLAPYMLSCLTCLMPYVLLCSRASYHTCCYTPCTSYLTYSTVNHYDMQPLLMGCYYRVFFIKDIINLPDLLIYVNLTILIYQPAFIRKPVL